MDFKLLNKLYEKKPIKYDEIKELSVGDCITMMNFLSQDLTILALLKKALGYIFNVHPTYFYIYLYCQIPRRAKAPFLKYPKKAEKKDDELVNKMKLVYGWGNKETECLTGVLTKLIDIDRPFFEERFGVNQVKKGKK